MAGAWHHAAVGLRDPAGERLALRPAVAVAEFDQLAREGFLEQQIARERRAGRLAAAVRYALHLYLR